MECFVQNISWSCKDDIPTNNIFIRYEIEEFKFCVRDAVDAETIVTKYTNDTARDHKFQQFVSLRKDYINIIIIKTNSEYLAFIMLY